MTNAGRIRMAPVLVLGTLGLASCPGPAPDDARRPAQADCQVTITEPFGAVVGFEVYDRDGLIRIRETSNDLDRVGSTLRVESVHDEGSLVREVRTVDGGNRSVTRYEYDNEGRLVRLDRGGRAFQSWSYDGDLLVEYADESGDNLFVTTYTHDADGRITQEVEVRNGITHAEFAWTWLDDRTAEAIDSRSRAEVVRKVTTYDEAGRLAGEQQDADNDGLFDFGYTQVWHDDDRLAERREVTGLLETWTFDDQDRLSEYRLEPFLSRAITHTSDWSCP